MEYLEEKSCSMIDVLPDPSSPSGAAPRVQAELRLVVASHVNGFDLAVYQIFELEIQVCLVILQHVWN